MGTQQLIPRAAAGHKWAYSHSGPSYGAQLDRGAYRPYDPAAPVGRLGRLARGMGRLGMNGLGDAAQDVQTASAIGTPVVLAGVSAAAASSAAAAGTAATILGMAPALAIPVIGAAIAGVTIAIVAILKSGCGQTCIVTTGWANDAERLLVQNISAYFARPIRTRSQQRVALANFDSILNYLDAQCGQAGLSTAGKNCIEDRQAGACKWKQTTTSQLLQYPGEPQPGECWNWVSGYRDPIANDPGVVEDSAVLDPNTASAYASPNTGATNTGATGFWSGDGGSVGSVAGADGGGVLGSGSGSLLLLGGLALLAMAAEG